MSGTRVTANSATAASESCSGSRQRVISRCERSLVARGLSMRCELQTSIFPRAVVPVPDRGPRQEDSSGRPLLSNRLLVGLRRQKNGSEEFPKRKEWSSDEQTGRQMPRLESPGQTCPPSSPRL